MVETSNADIEEDNGLQVVIPETTERVQNDSELQGSSQSQTESSCADEASSMSDDDDEDELSDENADLTAAELLEKGQGLFRAQKFAQSAEVLSKAVEVKVKELDVDEQDWHTDLAQYYLWFGDALLTKEEQSSDLFQFIKTDNVSDARLLASKMALETDNKESVSTTAVQTAAKSPIPSESLRTNEEMKAHPKSDAPTSSGSFSASSIQDFIPDSQSSSSAAVSSEVYAVNVDKEPLDVSTSKESLCVNKKSEGLSVDSSAAPNNSENTCQNAMDADDERDGEGVSDEQLAFEILEMARKSYVRKIDEAKVADLKDIEDVSFVHIRLADIYLMNEKYDEASKEYQEAVRFREKYNCPIISTICPNVSLGQALMFTGNYDSSIEAFNKALVVLDDLIAGKLEFPEGRNMEDFKNTREDIVLQLAELKKKAKEVEDTRIAPGPGSQTDASLLVPRTTNTLDTPQLDSVKVKLGVIRREEKPEKTSSTSLTDESEAATTSVDATNERVESSRKRDSSRSDAICEVTENGMERTQDTAASVSNAETSSAPKRHRVDLTGIV